MWTIYTGGGRQAAETCGLVAICGHDQRLAGLPGDEGPKQCLSWVSFNLQKSP